MLAVLEGDAFALGVDVRLHGLEARVVVGEGRLDDDTIDVVARAVDSRVVVARLYSRRPSALVIEPRGEPLRGDEIGRALRAQDPAVPCSLFLPNRLEKAGVALFRGAERVYPLDNGNSVSALQWWHEHLHSSSSRRAGFSASGTPARTSP